MRKHVAFVAVLALFGLMAWSDVIGAQPVDPREPEVRKLIDRYFRTWSNQDMERYGQCFMPKAAVQMIDPAGELVTMPLGPFLQSQRESHRRAATPLTETAESVEIRFEAGLARVVVFWKLIDGQRVETGYDHFTLMQADGNWRIANLIFYAAERNVAERDATKKP